MSRHVSHHRKNILRKRLAHFWRARVVDVWVSLPRPLGVLLAVLVAVTLVQSAAWAVGGVA